MTDISCMGCMFQDTQIESTGFLSVVFCLTNVKLLPPALYFHKISRALMNSYAPYGTRQGVRDCGVT